MLLSRSVETEREDDGRSRLELENGACGDRLSDILGVVSGWERRGTGGAGFGSYAMGRKPSSASDMVLDERVEARSCLYVLAGKVRVSVARSVKSECEMSEAEYLSCRLPKSTWAKLLAACRDQS